MIVFGLFPETTWNLWKSYLNFCCIWQWFCGNVVIWVEVWNSGRKIEFLADTWLGFVNNELSRSLVVLHLGFYEKQFSFLLKIRNRFYLFNCSHWISLDKGFSSYPFWVIASNWKALLKFDIVGGRWMYFWGCLWGWCECGFTTWNLLLLCPPSKGKVCLC